jgi:hypothetical protein
MFLSPQSARDTEDVAYPGRTLLPGEIRLIRLLPGKWTDPVRCELFEEVLGTTRYAALSYVWGSKNVTRPIFLNRRKFPVTVNLESALRHLRERIECGSHAAILWVDALCIDQRNESERTSQVQMMGDVYRQCRQAIVYLGDQLEDRACHDRPPTPRTYDPWKADSNVRHERTVTAVRTIFSMFERVAKSNTRHLTDILYGGSPTNASYEAVFYENLRRMMHPPFTPWWSRIWVVQEVTVPPEVIVVYGTASAPWRVLASAARNYFSHSTKCCMQFVKTMPRDAKVLDDCFNRILAIDDLRKEHYVSTPRQLAAPNRGSQTWPLLDLLRRFRDRKATDPRDKVYALLSIAYMSDPMAPDYSWTDVMVFRRATLTCIYDSQSLSVLSTDLGRKFRSDLPSWVPDWSAPGGSIYEARATMVELYNACPQDFVADRTTVYEVYFDDEGILQDLDYQIDVTSLHSEILLLMKGCKLGTINLVDDVMWGGDVARIWQSTLARWCEAYEKWSAARRDDRIFWSERTFWRILCGDTICKSEQGTDFRRTVPGDELAFMMWTEVSERSPRALTKDIYWSDEAEAWRDIRVLWGDKISWGATDPSTGLYVIDKIKTDDDFVPLEDGPTHESQPQWARELRIQELERFVKMTAWYTKEQPLVDASGELRKDYPWEAFLSHVTARLMAKFGRDFDLNVQTQLQLVPAIEIAIMTATLSRRLIASDNYVGLGPANTQVKDELYLLGGGKTPFILHAAETQFGPHVWNEIVGDCYVHDRMDFSKRNAGYDGEWHTICIC